MTLTQKERITALYRAVGLQFDGDLETWPLPLLERIAAAARQAGPSRPAGAASSTLVRSDLLLEVRNMCLRVLGNDYREAKRLVKQLDVLLGAESSETRPPYECWPHTHHEYDGAFRCSCGRTWGAITDPDGMCAGCAHDANAYPKLVESLRGQRT